MALDTATFKAYAGIIVQGIKEIDETAGAVAQEYVEAVVGEKEGLVDKSEVQKVLDKLPKARDSSEHVVSLAANLFQLSVAYLMS